MVVVGCEVATSSEGLLVDIAPAPLALLAIHESGGSGGEA